MVLQAIPLQLGPTIAIGLYLMGGLLMYIIGYYVLTNTPEQILKMKKEEYDRLYSEYVTDKAGQNPSQGVEQMEDQEVDNG